MVFRDAISAGQALAPFAGEEAAATVIQQAFAERDGRIAGLVDDIGFFERSLGQIAGSHFERFGMCQTDIEEVPDLSADEAMNTARQALAAKGDSRG